MRSLFIKGTAETPEVDFLDSDISFLKLTGRSIPEDADIYYSFIIGWLDRYFLDLQRQAPNRLNFKFHFHYYNTISYRYLSKIMSILKKIKKITNLNVLWYYDEKDEDMEEMGYDFEDIHKLDMEFIEVG